MRRLILAVFLALASYGKAYSQVYPPCSAGCGGPFYTNIVPLAPTSSNTLLIFGDSLGYGKAGPSSCISADNQPNVVVSSNLTGTCWADAVGHFYGASVRNLAVGGSTLTTAGFAPGITRLTTAFVCPSPQGIGNCQVGQTLPALNTFSGSSFFVMMQFAGVNDAGADQTGPSLFSAYLANMQTIVTALLADGIPANQIVFLSGPKSCADSFEPIWVDYSAINYAIARHTGSPYADVYQAFNLLGHTTTCADENPDPHPNDAGSLVWAQAIESVL